VSEISKAMGTQMSTTKKEEKRRKKKKKEEKNDDEEDSPYFLIEVFPSFNKRGMFQGA
jgi:hypothetical protein